MSNYSFDGFWINAACLTKKSLVESEIVALTDDSSVIVGSFDEKSGKWSEKRKITLPMRNVLCFSLKIADYNGQPSYFLLSKPTCFILDLNFNLIHKIDSKKGKKISGIESFLDGKIFITFSNVILVY